MFAAGAGLFVIGYALIWTGVERFRGKDYSLLSSLGVSGGGKVTPLPTSSDNPGNVQREQQQAQAIPASSTSSGGLAGPANTVTI